MSTLDPAGDKNAPKELFYAPIYVDPCGDKNAPKELFLGTHLLLSVRTFLAGTRWLRLSAGVHQLPLQVTPARPTPRSLRNLEWDEETISNTSRNAGRSCPAQAEGLYPEFMGIPCE